MRSEHLTGKSVDECEALCCSKPWCVSFDYYNNQNKCDLIDKRAEDVGGLNTGYPTYDHYSRVGCEEYCPDEFPDREAMCRDHQCKLCAECIVPPPADGLSRCTSELFGLLLVFCTDFW